MSPNRFVLVLVLISIVAIMVASNWSVSLPLSFLGTQARSLPLGVWLLLAFTIGFCISLLLQLLALPQAAKNDSPPQKSARRPYQPPQNSRQKSDRANEEEDDWDVEPPPKSEDWDLEEDEEYPQDVRGSYSEPDYEAKQEPTTKNVCGSVYSYSYRQPQDTGVGKSEAVRDANYRVINPPVREPVDTTADDDDWGFDFDDEEPNSR